MEMTKTLRELAEKATLEKAFPAVATWESNGQYHKQISKQIAEALKNHNERFKDG